jgi:hypothetical protein
MSVPASPLLIGAAGLLVGGAVGTLVARLRTARGSLGTGVGGALGVSAATLTWAAGTVYVGNGLDEVSSLPWLVAGGLFFWGVTVPALGVAAILVRWGPRPDEEAAGPGQASVD